MDISLRLDNYFRNPHVILTIIFSLFFLNVFSQQVSKPGLPYIQNYIPDEYNGAPQNWAIVQSKEGLIYFGNNEGVLEYDGSTWRTIPLPNFGIARALAISANNKIYVGGYNELGYLEPDETGLMKFTSLRGKLGDKNLHLIRDISISGDHICFITKNAILEWRNDTFSIRNSSSGFNLSKKIGDEIYVVENNLYLKKIKSNGFQEVINAADIGAKVITDVSHSKNELLILTYANGVFVTKNGELATLNAKTSKFLSKSLARRIIKLSNGNYAIATGKSGIITIDQDGNIIQATNKELGLQDNTIFRLFEGKQTGIWAATNNGISRVELLSPYSIFDDRHGIEGYVNDIIVNDGRAYLANYNGVLRIGKHKSLENNSYFEIISPLVSSTENSSKQAIEFLKSNDTLFVGTRAGLYVYVNHKLSQRFKLESGALFRSRNDPNRIYVGLIDGLASIVYRNGKWENDGRIDGIDDDIRKIKEDSHGNLWLESQVDGVWKVEAESIRYLDSLQNPKVKHFRSNKELPDGILFLRSVNEQIIFNIDNSIYKYDKKNDSIIRDNDFSERFKLPGKISLKSEDKEGNVWMSAQMRKNDDRNSRIKASKSGNGIYNLQKIPDERITQDVGVTLFSEGNNIVWYGGGGGVIRHDLNITGNDELDFNTHLRKVTVQNDSLIYGGVKNAKKNSSIPFNGNTFRFEYAATSFDNESKNQFQYILEGFDEDWSAWTPETKKDYTNIPEGDYTFKVRSKNIFNHIGQEDSYSFAILPPWQRTWWAFSVYVLAAIASVSLILKWRSKELQRKNENLENIIAVRTTEIQHKNEILNHQSEQLEQLNESKTRLYSNITHEFRTPLTVILGMTETLKPNVLDNHFEDAGKSLELIRRNGKNLLQLVNEMLDLAKVESGSIELNLVQIDIIPFVKYLGESFHSLAESKKINLTVYSEIETVEMDIDVNKMASIISNLLMNAIKFTEASGKIIVNLNRINSKDNKFFQIKVQDNGLGLAKDDIVHLFDRFYQVENEYSSKKKGTGIGLSLSKEFVELMKGTIKVESTVGKGSTFTVQIPITNNSPKKEETKITIDPPIAKVTSNEGTRFPFLADSTTLPLALIIEDNEDVAHYLKICLKGKYRTMHANNGGLGVEMAYERIPDIIISDVMMPIKDGFEVCATLKTDERTDHIPIILLTAKVTTEDRLTGLSHGADAYLAKPFNENELLIRLDQLVLVRKKLVDKIQKNGISKFLDKRSETPETKFLRKVVQFINEDLGNSDFGSTALAHKLYMSESQVYRKLKAITNKSTAVFIRSIRLQKAKELIQSTDKNISEIAYETGFNDPSWFSRTFKEEFGFTPSDSNK